IYLFARETEIGVTASEVAVRFELHPNVARHHLDKLAAGGYLDVAVQRAAHASVGRPSKRYRATAKAMGLEFPARRDDLLITLLGRALELVPREKAETMAEAVGIEDGQALAAPRASWRGRPSSRLVRASPRCWVPAPVKSCSRAAGPRRATQQCRAPPSEARTSSARSSSTRRYATPPLGTT